MCDMDPDDPTPLAPEVVEALRRTIPGWEARPAICRHRCECDCHTSGAIHVMACCTGCGHGHTRILDVYLHAHLRQCHDIVEL
jgi:hypothetical protein